MNLITSGGFGTPNIDADLVYLTPDYGDAPDAAAGTASGNYNTRAADNGPAHTIVTGLRIGVVGCARGEGTTTVALGLARALALEPRQRVLYLELDLKQPTADSELGLHAPAVGVNEFLDGRSEVPVLRHPTGGFWMLSGGGARPRPLESRAADRLPRLLRAADRVFDFVVGDCPPLLPDAEGLLLQDHFDGFVFVVRSRHAPLATVRRTAHMMRAGSVVGFVLNAQQDFIQR